MRKYFGLIVLGIVVASLATAGVVSAQQSTPQPLRVQVIMNNMRFQMSQTTLPANTPIEFVFINQDTIPHEGVLEARGAVDKAIEVNGQGEETQSIAGGETKTFTWTIPEPGQYQLGCHLPGHYEAGMVQAIDVVAQGAAAATTVTAAAPVATSTLPAATATTGAAAGGAVATATASVPATLPRTGAAAQPAGWMVAFGALVLVLGATLLTMKSRRA